VAFLDKSALWAVKEEVSYGVTPAIDYNTDLVELIQPSMDGEIEQIEREVIKNSLVKAQTLLGKETSSGSLPVEVSTTSDVGGALLNGDILFKSGMGVKVDPVANLILAAPSTGSQTIITMDAGTGVNYAVGQGLKLLVDAAAEYVTITGIVGDAISVSPDIVGTSVTDVQGLLSYTLATPATPTTSFSVQEYIEDSVTQIAYTYAGCVVTSMGLEFPIANIIKGTFAVAGAGFTSATTSDEVKQCRDFDPHLAKNMTFVYDAVSYDIADLSITVENEVYDVEAVTTAGISNKLVTGKSTVGGSITLDYTGLTLFNKYKAGTAGELFMTSTAGNGKKFGVYAPKVTLSSVSKSVDGAVYKDNAELQILSSDACVDGLEDALTIWFE